ncbi:MAG TPA: LCP family protein, partial [Ktedonobacteraceae bacterium]|nr:LCP family protein [Ktedonobacteraceae bacterium]
MPEQPFAEIPPGRLPPSKRTASRYTKRMRTFIYIFLLFALLVGGALAYGYSYFESNIQAPLVSFFRPVSRGNNEPPPDDSAITGRPWNILLLGSDNDNKYSFPALLTQVMMIVHVDPDNNSVYMISIPRDSWVYMSLNGGMHKIDQAFLFGASPHNNFDDGVRAARQTIEQDYGVTIDRYAWVGLSGFASVIDTLGGVDIDVTHPIVDDSYPDDTRANPNDPFAVKRLYIAPGPQHLNGLEALEYVRSRHADLVGDIGRTNRQQ